MKKRIVIGGAVLLGALVLAFWPRRPERPSATSADEAPEAKVASPSRPATMPESLPVARGEEPALERTSAPELPELLSTPPPAPSPETVKPLPLSPPPPTEDERLRFHAHALGLLDAHIARAEARLANVPKDSDEAQRIRTHIARMKKNRARQESAGPGPQAYDRPEVEDPAAPDETARDGSPRAPKRPARADDAVKDVSPSAP